MKDTFHTFEKEFNKHKDTPNLEVEFRLGKKGNGIFDTNVGEDTFFKLKKALGQHDGWESVKDTTTDVYYGKNGMRLQVNSMTDEQQCELKKTISKTDHISADLPFGDRDCSASCRRRDIRRHEEEGPHIVYQKGSEYRYDHVFGESGRHGR